MAMQLVIAMSTYHDWHRSITILVDLSYLQMNASYTLNDVFGRAKKAYKTYSSFFSIAESVIGVLAGGFLGTALQAPKFYFLFPAILLVIIFILVEFLKFHVNSSVGESILNELWAQNELEQEKREAQRSTGNFNRITRSIRSLNEVTCKIDSVIYEEPFEVYLCGLLDPFFDNPGEIVCTSDSKIYIHVYCNFVARVIEGKYTVGYADFAYRNDFPETTASQDMMRELKNVQCRALDTGRFSIYKTQFSNDVTHIIGCPIPTICEDGHSTGCILIAGNMKINDCCASEEVMSIFSRIVSNAIASYNESVFKQSAYQNPAKDTASSAP